MVATIVIQQMTGAAPGEFHTRDSNAVADKSGTRYMTSDQYDSSLTTYPIPIPTAANGISGSYWVTHCLNCTVAPDTYIKDVKYYQTWTTSPNSDWSLAGAGWAGTGIGPGLYIGASSATIADCKILTQGFPSGSYDQSEGTEGVFGYRISTATNGHAFYLGATSPASGGMVSITHFDSLENAIMVHSGQSLGATTGRTYCIVTQVLVGSGATAGNKDDKTATWSYTEA